MPKIDCPLKTASRQYPDQPAIILPNETITFFALERFVQRTTRHLKMRGIQQGQRVGINQENSYETIVALLSLWRLGAVACLLNTRLPPKRMAEQYDQLHCTQFPDTSALIDDQACSAEEHAQISLNQDATVLFTSGSSDEPKAVLHTFGNHYYNAMGSNENIPLTTGDRWLLQLPLYHVGGLGIVFRCLLAGAAVIIPDHPRSTYECLSMFDATHASVVPTQLYRLLRSDARAAVPAKLKALLVGGGPISPHLIEEALSLNYPVYISYGLTEMASQVATSTTDDIKTKKNTSAKILKHRLLKISPANEILVKGKTLFKGYIQNDVLEQPLTGDGWFPTGDLGIMTANNRIELIGRKDNMFVSGGENIQPEEIEKYLCQYDDVVQAIVVPKPDQEFGSRPVAFIQTDTGTIVETKKLQLYLSQYLPSYKIPQEIYAWPNDDNAKVSPKLARKFLLDYLLHKESHVTC